MTDIDSPDIMSASSDEANEVFNDVIDHAETAEEESKEEETLETKDESSSDSDGDDTTEEPKPKKRNKVQERIDKLTAEKYEQQRVIEHLQQQAQANLPPPDVQTQPRPTLEQFGYDEEKHLEAVTQWARNNAAAEQQAESNRQTELTRQLAEQRTAANFQYKVEQFTESNPDFAQVTGNPSLTITGEMAQAIQVHEDGPSIAYHLGKNPELAGTIAQLSPVQQMMEIGKLGIELSAPKPVQQKVASKAPPPIKPVGSNAAVSKNAEEMPYEEYRRKRMSGELR